MKQELFEMVQVTVFILVNSEKWSSYGPKTSVLTNLSNDMKKGMFFGPTSLIFSDFMNKIGTVTVTSSNNFCVILSPSDEFQFLGS